MSHLPSGPAGPARFIKKANLFDFRLKDYAGTAFTVIRNFTRFTFPNVDIFFSFERPIITK